MSIVAKVIYLNESWLCLIFIQFMQTSEQPWIKENEEVREPREMEHLRVVCPSYHALNLLLPHLGAVEFFVIVFICHVPV